MCLLTAALLVLGGLTGCAALLAAQQLDAYDLGGGDSIPSINSVVGERKIEEVSTNTTNGVTTKGYQYASDTVSDDLIAWLSLLLDDHGYLGLTSFNVTEIPGSGQIAAESAEGGKIIIIEIDYRSDGYTISITKGEGTLTVK